MKEENKNLVNYENLIDDLKSKLIHNGQIVLDDHLRDTMEIVDKQIWGEEYLKWRKENPDAILSDTSILMLNKNAKEISLAILHEVSESAEERLAPVEIRKIKRQKPSS